MVHSSVFQSADVEVSRGVVVSGTTVGPEPNVGGLDTL